MEWLTYSLYGTLALLGAYTLRHYSFTINRLFGIQRHPYIDVDTANWPAVTAVVIAHQAEGRIARSLEALLQVEYPPEKLHVVAVSDHSEDGTRDIVEQIACRAPGRLSVCRLDAPEAGRAAALQEAALRAGSEILLVFDAGCVPGRGLVKQLVAAFFDPEVGAVMGRAVPLNVGSNLLTRLQDLERSGDYQVDQQARMNLELILHPAGAATGIRRSALESIGGWREQPVAGDLDLACRLLLKGWKTVYQNRSECYESVPEAWPDRVRQIARWTVEHHAALARYSFALLFNPRVSLRERWDGLLQLGSYGASLLLLLGWVLAVGLLYLGAAPFPALLTLLALTCYSGVGCCPTVFEIAAAARLDGHRGRIRLLPLALFSFLVSLLTVAGVTLRMLLPGRQRDRHGRSRTVGVPERWVL